MSMRKNGAATEHGFHQVTAQYAETGTFHAPQPARKMFATQHPTKDASMANGHHRIIATTALLRIATAQYSALKASVTYQTKKYA